MSEKRVILASERRSRTRIDIERGSVSERVKSEASYVHRGWFL